MYFPVSGVDVHPLVPPLVAFGISVLTSMGGVSGAFLLLPFQLTVLGYSSPSVSATNQLFNVVATPSGVYRYTKEGRMVWAIALLITVSTLPGIFLGAWLRIHILYEPAKFKAFAGAVLTLMALRLLWDVWRSSREPQKSVSVVSSAVLGFFRTRFEFGSRSYGFSNIPLVILCLAVGILGGAYGIGGGAIVAPFLVTFLRLPVHAVAGAALFGTLVSSIAGVFFYQWQAYYLSDSSLAADWGLGLLFGIGGFFGIYVGSRLQKHVQTRYIKLILAATTLIIATRYLTRVGM